MIIYFSGTGNSYSVAKKLAEKTKDIIVPLKNANNNGDSEITFIFPTYAMDIPPNVKEFIKNFQLKPEQIIRGISVSGGNNGNSEYSFNELIKAKGMKVQKFKNIIMTDNFVPGAFNWKIDYKDVDIDKAINEFIIDEYINNSKKNIGYDISYKMLFTSAIKKLMKKKVDKNKCVGCGVCNDICPNNNIKMIDSKAIIGQECTECFGCIHWCPKQAIYIKKGLKSKSQYTRDGVTFKELNI